MVEAIAKGGTVSLDTLWPLLVCETCRKPTRHRFLESRRLFRQKSVEHRFECGECRRDRTYGYDFVRDKPTEINRS